MVGWARGARPRGEELPRTFSFQRKVFVFYSVLILGVSILLCSFFSAFIFGILRKDAEGYFRQVLEKVSSNLDNMVFSLDVVSTQLIASSDLQESFISANASANAGRGEGGNYFDRDLKAKKKAMDILVSINSAKDRVKRLSLFTPAGTFVSLGNELEDSDRVRQSVKLERWYSGTEGDGVFYKLLPPHKDDWAREDKAALVVSLVRPFVATYSSYENLGAIEIQQSYSRLAEICGLDDPSGRLKLMVVDRNAEPIYPYGDAAIAAEAGVYYGGSKRASPGEIYSFRNTISGVAEYACFVTTKDAPWTVILSQPRADFLGPAYNILFFLLLICAVVMILSLLAIFLVTRSITIPIRELRESVESLTLEDASIRLPATHNEIDLLKDAFNDMLRRLKDSTDEIIQAKASEGHSRFLALQAQINPHFLYNSIMSISAAGQEAGSAKVQLMCAQLGKLFRYVASSDGSAATLQDESDHARTYLEFIKWRYEELLEFSIDIPEEMQGVRVGKLILQPIIENCFSHGFKNVRPPYRVRVSGASSGDSWELRIVDNGCGFDATSLERLERQFARVDGSLREGRPFDEGEAAGMALINIYNRLKLLYKDRARFAIGKGPEGGAAVSIGGVVSI
jgi:two-component system, sensor histidine kinase YesM